MPPFGHATPLTAFVDPDLLGYDEVWAAAGTWHDVFAVRPDDLVRASGGTSPTSSADAGAAASARDDESNGQPSSGGAGSLAVDSAKTAGSTVMNVDAAAGDDRLAVGLDVDELALDEQLAAVAPGQPAAAGDRPVQRRRLARSGSSARR